MGQHAKLSASSSHRWLNCPPSVKLSEQFHDESSSYAEEGTQAHSLCEYKLEEALGLNSVDPTPALSYYTEEMNDCANEYASYVIGVLEQERALDNDPQIFIEQRVDFSAYVQHGFGTCDTVIISDGTIYIIDFKFGKGVKVESVGNSQLRIYALGALEHFGMLYDISTVKMVVFQPRLEHISEEILSIGMLIEWAETVLMPTAQLAYDGEGEFKAGEHCRFCKAKAQCRARANANMALAQYDFEEPALLEKTEVSSILQQADELISWANDVKDFALAEALKGVKFHGFKVVEGRSNRKYTDESAVAETVTSIGLDPYEKKLLGITAMTTLLGKKRFNDSLGEFITKPQGKPVLVPEVDKRQEININTAADDFADHTN